MNTRETSWFVIISFHIYTLTNGLTLSEPNVCLREVSQKKANVQYDKVLQMICCSNYTERDNRCEPCPPGLFGQNCSVECLPGTWGSQCSNSCTCVAEKTCHAKIGCVCKAGFHGERCEQYCSYPMYGPNCARKCYCPKHNSCHPLTGECACPTGFTGSDCTTKCLDGENCQHPCNCSVDKLCHHVTGQCHCLEGKPGPDCTEMNEGFSTTAIEIGVIFAIFILTVTAVVLSCLYQRKEKLQRRRANVMTDSNGYRTEDEKGVNDKRRSYIKNFSDKKVEEATENSIITISCVRLL